MSDKKISDLESLDSKEKVKRRAEDKEKDQKEVVEKFEKEYGDHPVIEAMKSIEGEGIDEKDTRKIEALLIIESGKDNFDIKQALGKVLLRGNITLISGPNVEINETQSEFVQRNKEFNKTTYNKIIEQVEGKGKNADLEGEQGQKLAEYKISTPELPAMERLRDSGQLTKSTEGMIERIIEEEKPFDQEFILQIESGDREIVERVLDLIPDQGNNKGVVENMENFNKDFPDILEKIDQGVEGEKKEEQQEEQQAYKVIAQSYIKIGEGPEANERNLETAIRTASAHILKNDTERNIKKDTPEFKQSMLDIQSERSEKRLEGLMTLIKIESQGKKVEATEGEKAKLTKEQYKQEVEDIKRRGKELRTKYTKPEESEHLKEQIEKLRVEYLQLRERAPENNTDKKEANIQVLAGGKLDKVSELKEAV